MHLFWPARYIWMMGAHVCLLIFTECNLWNANAHINTPTSTQEAAMLTRTVWTHTHIHTSPSEDLSMGGLSVSMVTEIGRYCMCWGVCSVCEYGCVGIVSLCVSLAGSHPETDCRPGISPTSIAATFTPFSLTVPFEGIVFWFSLVKDIVLLALAAHPIARLHSRYKIIG